MRVRQKIPPKPGLAHGWLFPDEGPATGTGSLLIARYPFVPLALLLVGA